ncbi:uncharacterized protein LOC126847401 isoform X2 [Adelges cooleyi]|nr:uncharacterized protein LOC126847401 isoform X2 [Adelges cooleyi]XP_050443576.1 uncharacterized protein LOC126847401 isoform X2 [Adelges cooleyi]XP_050443585.1 uncharacterized protein LOC126847401 isoform X2 [Adelges cooleyi]
MKLFCFLMSVFFVNVSTREPIEEYRKQIAITNTLIEVAHNTNNCIVEDNFIANGLEHVIKQIVFNDVFLFEYVNINFINQIIVSLEYPCNNSIQASIGLQETLKNEFVDALKIVAPDVPSEDLMNLDLPQLGDQRRSLIGKALNNIICQAIDFENITNLLEERRYAPTENSRNRIIRTSDRNLYQVPLTKMCQFITLFLLTTCPTEDVFVLPNEDKKTCTLKIKGLTPEVQVYREIDGIWWQVNPDDIDKRVETLKNQIC